ncbi:MAG: DUF433 domain-containing protein [Rhodobacteraceae bacterium]|nr:DUF433 domain-containing protein [Paracoccaceae bacterium]
MTDREGKVLKDKLLSVSTTGQMVWAEVLARRFGQFDYSANGPAVRFYPRPWDRRIVIDPALCFGAPSVSGIPTWLVKSRWESGESRSDIADDFTLSQDDITSALAFEGLDALP